MRWRRVSSEVFVIQLILIIYQSILDCFVYLFIYLSHCKIKDNTPNHSKPVENLLADNKNSTKDWYPKWIKNVSECLSNLTMGQLNLSLMKKGLDIQLPIKPFQCFVTFVILNTCKCIYNFVNKIAQSWKYFLTCSGANHKTGGSHTYCSGQRRLC